MSVPSETLPWSFHHIHVENFVIGKMVPLFKVLSPVMFIFFSSEVESV